MSSAGISVVPPYIGTYFNTLLYSLELLGVYVYFFRTKRSRSDSKLIKGAVLLSLLSDTLGTIASIAMVYIFTLVFPTMNPPSISRIYWPFELWISTNMVSASVFQMYMVIRYFRVSGNWILTFIVFLLIGSSFGFTIHLLAIYRAVIPALFSTQASTFYSARFIVLVLATAMTTDILISAALIWQLHTTKATSPRLKSIIHRISTQTIKTGTIPCLFAMVVLITYLAYKDGSISVCFAFMLGRVYTLTMLFTLIFRDSLANPSGVDTVADTTFVDVERLGVSQDLKGTETGGLVAPGVGGRGLGGTTAVKTVDGTEVECGPGETTTHRTPSVHDERVDGEERLGALPAMDDEEKKVQGPPAL